MIKAINRQIIEVTDIQSPYYERALLVVKANHEQTGQDILDQHAQDILQSIDAPSAIKKRGNAYYWAIRLVPVAFLGGIIGSLLTILF